MRVDTLSLSLSLSPPPLSLSPPHILSVSVSVMHPVLIKLVHPLPWNFWSLPLSSTFLFISPLASQSSLAFLSAIYLLWQVLSSVSLTLSVYPFRYLSALTGPFTPHPPTLSLLVPAFSLPCRAHSSVSPPLSVHPFRCLSALTGPFICFPNTLSPFPFRYLSALSCPFICFPTTLCSSFPLSVCLGRSIHLFPHHSLFILSVICLPWQVHSSVSLTLSLLPFRYLSALTYPSICFPNTLCPSFSLSLCLDLPTHLFPQHPVLPFRYLSALTYPSICFPNTLSFLFAICLPWPIHPSVSPTPCPSFSLSLCLDLPIHLFPQHSLSFLFAISLPWPTHPSVSPTPCPSFSLSLCLDLPTHLFPQHPVLPFRYLSALTCLPICFPNAVCSSFPLSVYLDVPIHLFHQHSLSFLSAISLPFRYLPIHLFPNTLFNQNHYTYQMAT